MPNFKLVVKKGAGVPASGSLGTGELGYNTSLKKLYIGNTGSAASGVSMDGLTHSTALGTEAAPGYTFTGDLNTGIFSPAGDVLSLSTSGTEKLRVLANGNVGIGNIAPTDKLEVTGNVKATQLKSTIATGTAPMTVSSTTKVTNLNSDLFDDLDSSQFLRSDTNDEISGWGLITVGTPVNTVISSSGTQLASTPIGSSLWHDTFAFSRFYTRTVEKTTNGTDWISAADFPQLFIQKENQTILVLDAPTELGVRFTWTGVSYSLASWLVIASTYSYPAPVANVLIQSSTDGVTWTTRHTSQNTLATNPRWFYVSGFGADNYFRLTLTYVSGGAIRLSSIKLLSSRWGDQGLGKELESPWDWDVNRNLSTIGTIQGTQLKSTVGTGTAPLTVTSTTKVTNLNADKLDDMESATANTASTIVARDASGNFSAGTITAALNGNAATATKLGTSTVGSTTLPIYLNAGAPTALTQANLRIGLFGSTAIGSASQPVYIAANGVATAGNSIPSVSSTPTDGATTVAISSDWAFDNVKTAVPTGALFTDTWVANSLNAAGYVAAPGAVANKVWKTDASGNPAWRDDADTKYTVNDGALALEASATAGATNTTVTVETGTGFTANEPAGTITYKYRIGPALTNLVSSMTGAGSGFLKKSGADTYSLDTNTYLTTHPTISVITDTTSNASPAHGGTFTAIDSVIRDGNGHVTKVNTKTVTLPSDNDTLNTTGSSNSDSKLFLVGATSQATSAVTYSDSEVYTTNGTLTTKEVQVGGTAATMKYDSTSKSIKFVFA